MTTLSGAHGAAPRIVLATLTAALALTLFCVSHGRSGGGSVLAPLCWTALVLLSFVGWGSAVAYVVAKDAHADVGLRAAWGMAVTLAVGGLLVLAGAATRTSLGAHVALGVALLVAHSFTSRMTTVDRFRLVAAHLRENPWFFCGMIVVGVLLALQSTLAVHDSPEWAVADDGPAYAVFPKQMLEAGTFDQPFSFRRLSAYGGQSFLQAFLLLELRPERLHLFDRSLCTLGVLLLLLGVPRSRLRVPRELLILPMLVVVTLENVGVNLASEMSGVVMLLGLYRTLQWEPIEKGGRPLGAAALVAALGAGAMTLRQNYAAPVVVMLVVSYAASFFFSKAELEERARELREPALALGISFALLLPWAVAARRSCGTFAYPLVAGNYRAGSGFGRDREWLVQLQLYWDNVTHTLPIASVHAFVLAGVIARDRAPRRAMQALLVASLVGLALLLQLAWHASPDDYKRYYFGFEVAMVCAITLTAFSQDGTESADVGGEPALGARVTWPAVLVVIASLWQLQAMLPRTQRELGAALEERTADQAQAAAGAARDGDDIYRRLQLSTAEKASMLVMLDEPYRLDFARNPIAIIDLPGVVSPAPGMPTGDARALSAYLGGLGIRYVAFVRPARSKHLYSRTIWEGHAASNGDLPQHRIARTVLDVMAEFEDLAVHHARVFDDGGMVVVDLEQGAP